LARIIDDTFLHYICITLWISKSVCLLTDCLACSFFSKDRWTSLVKTIRSGRIAKTRTTWALRFHNLSHKLEHSLSVGYHSSRLFDRTMCDRSEHHHSSFPCGNTEWCHGGTRPVQGRWYTNKMLLDTWLTTWSPDASHGQVYVFVSHVQWTNGRPRRGMSEGRSRGTMREGWPLPEARKVERLYSRER
jgi:hypothetical protein